MTHLLNLFIMNQINTWKEKLESGDEYYNKNFSLDSDKYDLNIKDKD